MTTSPRTHLTWTLDLGRSREKKPYVALVTGTDGTYGLEREFVRHAETVSNDFGRDTGYVWSISELGLYEVQTRGRDAERLYRMVYIADGTGKRPAGELAYRTIDAERARAIAELLEAGKSFEAARQATESL